MLRVVALVAKLANPFLVESAKLPFPFFIILALAFAFGAFGAAFGVLVVGVGAVLLFAASPAVLELVADALPFALSLRFGLRRAS